MTSQQTLLVSQATKHSACTPERVRASGHHDRRAYLSLQALEAFLGTGWELGMNSEVISQIGAVLVAILSVVAGVTVLMKDRSGLHQLERLGAVIDSLESSAEERKLLEEIRDDMALNWGMKRLKRHERLGLRVAAYALFLSGFVVAVWLWSPLVVPGSPVVPRLPLDLAVLIQGSPGALWTMALVTYLLRQRELNEWESAERKRRGLPTLPA